MSRLGLGVRVRVCTLNISSISVTSQNGTPSLHPKLLPDGVPAFACGQHIYHSRRMCSSGVEVCDLEFKITDIFPRHIPHFVTRMTWHLHNPSTLLHWVCSDLHGQFLLHRHPKNRQSYRTWHCDRRRRSDDQVADVVLLPTPTHQKENRPRPTRRCACC